MAPDPLLIGGIGAGLAAAVCQSGSYVFSRLAVLRHHGISQLMVTAHLVMGLAAGVILPFAWTASVPPWTTYALPLLGSAVFYMLGQLGLFLLMRNVHASRVAPLLGLKLVVLAVITTTFLHQSLAISQWSATALCVAAALMLNYSGTALSPASLGCLALACVSYSLSDLSIAVLVRSLRSLPMLHASILGVCLSYLLCGFAALALIPLLGVRRTVGDWHLATPFAACWFLAMVFLYACFGTVGALYGNILQSTRGLISVLLGAVLARMGWLTLESRVSRVVLMRRIAAAGLMSVAIWLFQAWR